MTEKEKIELIDAQIAELKAQRDALTKRESVYGGPHFNSLVKDRDAQRIQSAMSSLVRLVYGIESTNRQTLSRKDCTNIKQIIEEIAQVLSREINFDASNKEPPITDEEIREICSKDGYLTDARKVVIHFSDRGYNALFRGTNIKTVLEFLQLSDAEIRKVRNCGVATSAVLISARNQIAAALEDA